VDISRRLCFAVCDIVIGPPLEKRRIDKWVHWHRDDVGRELGL
jgi:hypothetical protein